MVVLCKLLIASFHLIGYCDFLHFYLWLRDHLGIFLSEEMNSPEQKRGRQAHMALRHGTMHGAKVFVTILCYD